MFAFRQLSHVLRKPPIQNLKCLQVVGVNFQTNGDGDFVQSHVGNFPKIECNNNPGKCVFPLSAAVGLLSLNGFEDDLY